MFQNLTLFVLLFCVTDIFATPFPVPPCSPTFCALNGARALCAPPDPSCVPPRPLETCTFLPPRSCGLWAIGPPRLSCAHACPTICLPEDHRPVATDGVAYCTDCSFVHASCLSYFSVVGPIARGVDYAMTVEPPPSPSPSPSPNPSPSFSSTVSPSVSATMSSTPVSVTMPEEEDGEQEEEDEDVEPSPLPSHTPESSRLPAGLGYLWNWGILNGPV